MRFPRALVACSLTLALLSCGDSTVAVPPGGGTSPVRGPAPAPQELLRWSDAATWDGVLPAANAHVTIPAGRAVLLDVDPPPLASLTVNGELHFADRDVELRADWVLVHGRLVAGTAQAPLRSRAVITLTDLHLGEDVHGMGDRVLGVMGSGTLELHGQPRVSWTRLGATAPAGATTLTLEGPVDWQPGDRVVIASTDYDMRQAEERTVTHVDGTVVHLNAPLQYGHHGERHAYGGRTLDVRAEVGLLTRNVVVRGAEDATTSRFGGQIMVMGQSQVRLSNTELTRMGQHGLLRRYPIHFHMQGDQPDSYVKSSSLHQLFNRCVTIHGTNRLTLQDNVAYDTLGHCFFMEDGAETGNVLEGNLGLLTRAPNTGRGDVRLLPSDRTPATFWITNPANVLRGNVAGGSDGFGFWYAMPPHPTGLSDPSRTPANAGIFPQRTPLTEFTGNVGHSNRTALMVDFGVDPVTLDTRTMHYAARTDPADAKSALVTVAFDDFTGYRNRDRAVWLRGSQHVMRRAVLADNHIAATFASNTTTLEDSLVVGESPNLGNPRAGDPTGPGGRSLPDPRNPGRKLMGFEFYDGVVGVRNTVFANFTPAEGRPAAALDAKQRNAFLMNFRNSAQGVTFVNAQPVAFTRQAEPTPEDVSRDASHDSTRTALFQDPDGSVSGRAGSVIVLDDPFLVDGACEARAGWNARVCPAAGHGQLSVRDESAAPAGVAPVTLTRLDAARPALRLWGTPSTGANTYFRTPVLTGRAYAVQPSAAPARLRLDFSDRAAGDWLTVELPYGAEPHVYTGSPDTAAALTVVPAADLAAAATTAYAWDGQKVTVKLVVREGRSREQVTLCLTPRCS